MKKLIRQFRTPNGLVSIFDDNERLTVDIDKCNQLFIDVASVLDWQTHPLLEVAQPIGFETVKAIMREVDELKNKAQKEQRESAQNEAWKKLNPFPKGRWSK